MCDWATQQLVEQIVQEKCQAGEMFTAFDVSVEAKKRGSRERHRDMRAVVHACFEQGIMGPAYQRNRITIPGAAAKAWLYYHYQSDPYTYQAMDRSHLPTKRGHLASQNGAYQVDKRARICVPARLLRQAGFRPGENVLVVAAARAKYLLLTRQQPATQGYQILSAYRVDRSGNIRIMQGTLKKGQLGGTAYEMDGDAQQITLRLHQN
jgi:hypothetical protein